MPESSVTAVNKDEGLPLSEKLRDVGVLIDKLKVGLYTTHRPDGHLVSRPMHVARRENADLLLIANLESHKVDEIEQDAHVNMAFYDHQTREWASFSGKNELVTDRKLINDLYHDDLRAWFGDKGDGKHDGSANDPRIAVLKLRAHSITCSIRDRSPEEMLASIKVAAQKGDIAKVSSIREITPQELGRAHC